MESKIKALFMKTLKYGLLTTGGIILCLFMILFLFRTERGMQYMARMAEKSFNTEDVHVKIGRITGSFPSRLKCTAVSISDSRGEWLFLDDITLYWRPSSLIKKRMEIGLIMVGDVRFMRYPDVPEIEDSGKESKSVFFSHIPTVLIEQLKCPRFYLGKSVFGVEAVFSIGGRMAADPSISGLEGALLIERTDMPDSFIDIKGAIKGVEPFVNLDVRAGESEGGLIQGLFGLTKTGPVSIILTGEGPIDEWKGQLIAEAEKSARIESDVSIGIREGAKLRVEGMIDLRDNRIPETILPLINDGPVRFDLDMETDGKGHLRFNNARLDTGRMGFSIKGEFDPDKKHIEAFFGLDIMDLSSFNVMAGNRTEGKLSLKGDLSGSFDSARGTFSLSFVDPLFADVSAKGMTAEIILETGLSVSDPFQSMRIRGNGSVDDFRVRDLSSRLPFKEFEWSADADLEKGKPINVRGSTVTAESLVLGFSGVIDPLSQSVDGNANLIINDLSRLSGITGTALKGGMDMRAKVNGDLISRDIRAEIEGNGKDLAFLHPVALAMIEPGVSFKSNIHLDRERQLRFSDTAIISDFMTITGSGSMDMSTLDVGVDVNLVIPSLSVLSQAVGKDMEGILRADVNIKGAYDDPRISTQVIVDEMKFQGIRSRRAHLVSNVKNLFDNPKGEFKLDLEQKGYNIIAGGLFILEYPDLLLTDLSLSLPGARLTGDIEADLAAVILKGSLKGQSGDLKSLSQILGEQIKGRAEADILLMKGQKGQDLALKLHGEQLESSFASVDELNMEIKLWDVFNSLTGNAVIESGSIRNRELSLETLRVEIDGGMNDARFRLAGIGDSPQKFSMETSGKYSFSGGDVDLELGSLHGDYAGYPVFLRKTLIIRKVSKDIEIEGLDIGLFQGNLKASGKISGESVRFDGRMEGIPVETLHGFGFPDLRGTVVADVSVSGTLKKPAGNIEIHIMKIVSKDLSLQHLPPSDLLVKINLKDYRLNADILVSGWSEKPISAVLEIPVEISFLPPSFSLGKNGEIQGELSAEMSINLIPSIFILEDHIMEGGLSAFLTLQGSLENPQINGRVGLSRGYYENMVAGLILKDIDVDIAVRGDQLVLVKADAKDSKKGMVEATGRMIFRPGEKFPFLLNLILKDTKVTARDNMTITTDGTLGISGDMSGGILSGFLNVKDAEFLIPNRLPSTIRDMDVIEINKPVKLQEIEQKSVKKSSYPLDLNLEVEAPGEVFIRGRGIDSEWKSRLNISGNTVEPLIKGDLSLIRGRYNFFGKPFSLTQGIIAFRGNSPPNPDIIVTGEHKMSDMVARIGISSSQPELDIILESDPYFPQDEILSRVLFGRSVANITPIQALKLAQAVNNLRGEGNDIINFFDRTRSFLGLDQLEVKQTGENLVETSVSIGKYVGESIYLEVEKGLGADSGKVSVEVDLTPNITLESEAGMDSESAVGINWKWDY